MFMVSASIRNSFGDDCSHYVLRAERLLKRMTKRNTDEWSEQVVLDMIANTEAVSKDKPTAIRLEPIG